MPGGVLKQRLLDLGVEDEHMMLAVELGEELAELRWWILRVAWLPDGLTDHQKPKPVNADTLKRPLEVVTSFEATAYPCFLGAAEISARTAESGNGKPLCKKTIDHALNVLRRPLGPNAAGCDTFEPIYHELPRANSRTTYKQVLWQYLIGYIPPVRKSKFEEKRLRVEELRKRLIGNWVPYERELSSQTTGNSVPSNREPSSHEYGNYSGGTQSGYEHTASEAIAAFERWYAIYPRKVGRANAAKAFRRAVTAIARTQQVAQEQAVEWLCEVTRSFACSPKGQAGVYCPHPATWLNEARYEDDPKEWNRHANRNYQPGSGQSYSGDTAKQPGEF